MANSAASVPRERRLCATKVAPSGIDGYGTVIEEVRRLYASGETDAALELASLINAESANDDGSIDIDDESFVNTCQTPPEPTLAAVPHLNLDAKELRKLPLDPRAGFFLSYVDGSTTLASILEVLAAAGIGRSEALSVLQKLIVLGAVALLAI